MLRHADGMMAAAVFLVCSAVCPCPFLIRVYLPGRARFGGGAGLVFVFCNYYNDWSD